MQSDKLPNLNIYSSVNIVKPVALCGDNVILYTQNGETYSSLLGCQ